MKNSHKSSHTSLIDPQFKGLIFDDFANLAQSYDALIKEFYGYYKEKGHDRPNMFGFVAVRHVVKFSSSTKSVFTENIVGQKTTAIHAPLIPGESQEEQNERRIKLLTAFDHTKRASHILAMSLLVGLLRGRGIKKLIKKHMEDDIKTSKKR